MSSANCCPADAIFFSPYQWDISLWSFCIQRRHRLFHNRWRQWISCRFHWRNKYRNSACLSVVYYKKRNGIHIGTDVKIGRTVSSIVHSFFRNPSNILVYICDTSDKHQAARDRKFKIWFKRYASLDDLVFVSEVIDVEDDSYFASMILSRRTTDFYQIQTTFHDYFQDLRSKLE